MLCLIGYMGSQGFVNPNSAALALAEQGKRLGAASALLGTVQLSCARWPDSPSAPGRPAAPCP